MTSPPILSVVVPTKNRAATAMPLLDSLLRLPADDLEVVVQDCSDDDELERAVTRFAADPRLAYRHGPTVSMTQNWNAAMARVRGRFTIFVGDDDGCSERILAAARWAAESGIDWITWKRASTYYWPSWSVADCAGHLFVYAAKGTQERVDASAEVVAASHGYGERIFRLPIAYHGLVRTEAMRALHERTGAYFKGLTPDYYSAFALSGFVGAGIVIDLPLSIIGSSAGSNTARAAREGNRKTPVEHLDEYRDFERPNVLPDFRLISSLLAEAMMSGLQSANRRELIDNLDLPALYADHICDKPASIAPGLARFWRASRSLGRDQLRDFARLAVRVPTVARTLLRQELRRVVFTLMGRDPMSFRMTADRFAAADIVAAMRAHDDYYRDVRLPF
jgi:hypothetical protein